MNPLLKIAVYAFSILTLSACQKTDTTFRGTELGDSIPTTDFTLIDQHNRPFTLSENKGNVVLLFFGFTYCPDVCPLTLSTWKKVGDLLGDDAQRVRFVYVTVDPERDTPERLKTHLAIFSPDFIGLTGPIENLKEVYAAYGVYREKNQISDSATGYLINHTARINIIDPQGNWRLTFSHDSAAEDIGHDIRLLLKTEK
ncbi:MAG: SCO family protein [bacterium]